MYRHVSYTIIYIRVLVVKRIIILRLNHNESLQISGSSSHTQSYATNRNDMFFWISRSAAMKLKYY